MQGALVWLFQSGGDVGELLQAKVQTALSRYLTLESLGVALQDCFVVIAVVYVVAALASVCIPGGEATKS